MHLLIDGYNGDKQRLWNAELLRTFLDCYPSRIGMHKISAPQIQVSYEDTPEDSWVIGFVIIAESHISVHAFPERDYVAVDIFSCKAFDSNKVLGDIKALYRLGKVKMWLLDRGLEQFGRGSEKTEQKKKEAQCQDLESQG